MNVTSARYRESLHAYIILLYGNGMLLRWLICGFHKIMSDFMKTDSKFITDSIQGPIPKNYKKNLLRALNSRKIFLGFDKLKYLLPYLLVNHVDYFNLKKK